jgi:hypothetical protein
LVDSISDCTLEIGERLLVIESKLPEGEYEDFVEQYLEWTLSKAAKFTKVAKRFRAVPKRALKNMSVNAKYELAKTAVSEQAFRRAVKLAGTRKVDRKDILRIKKTSVPTGYSPMKKARKKCVFSRTKASKRAGIRSSGIAIKHKDGVIELLVEEDVKQRIAECTLISYDKSGQELKRVTNPTATVDLKRKKLVVQL